MNGEIWEIMRHRVGEDPELVDVGTPEEIRRKMNHIAGQLGVAIREDLDSIEFEDGDVLTRARPASKRTIEALRALVHGDRDDE